MSNTQALIAGTPLQSSSLVDIIRHAHANHHENLFNNAAQVFNHSFYWEGLRGGGAGGGVASGKIGEMIDSKWGSFAAFRKEFIDTGIAAFGSGW